MSGREIVLVAAVLLAGTALRSRDLGGPSFWYDEVVTMRLAETPTPTALLGLLSRIDATRAPLHPLLLQGWLKAFGSSEASARALSVLFGVATIGLLYPLGRLTFDRSTGRWAMAFAAASPLLIHYSQEVRMYAALVFLTTFAWTLLFAMDGGRPGGWRVVGYVACLFASMFTHPLALLMWGTLATASALDARGFFGSRRRWLGVHLAPIVAASPWLGHYFDHAPEFLSGRLPIRFLLGTPIGFLGGDFAILAAMLAVIACGAWSRATGPDLPSRPRPIAACLSLWLILPPAALYAYSLIANPIFGPSRYTLFCAPAFLVLLAQGIARMPVPARAAAGAGIALIVLGSPPVAPPRASWREAAAALRAYASRTSAEDPVLVVSSDAEPNVEVETARYYLGDALDVEPYSRRLSIRLRSEGHRAVFLSSPGEPPEAERPWLGPPLKGEGFPRTPHLHRLATASPASVPGPETPGR